MRVERECMVCLQANDAKEDDPVELEDVGYAQCEAEDYAEDPGPVSLSLDYCALFLFSFEEFGKTYH